MKPKGFLFPALFIAAATFLHGCGEAGPSAPALRGPTLETSWSNNAAGLLRCRPLDYDSVTAMVTPAGGDVRVSKHLLSIPPQALARPTRITLVVRPDTVNYVQFGPDGLVFNAPVTLTMSYVNCHADASTDPKRIAYTTDDLVILEYEPSVDDTILILKGIREQIGKTFGDEITITVEPDTEPRVRVRAW